MVDFLQVAEVVPAGLGLVPELLLVGSVLVVDFLQVVEVVPVGLGLISVLSLPTPGSSWTDWSHVWGREAYLRRALEKLNLGYPRDSDD